MIHDNVYISNSLEDYLAAIYIISKNKNIVRITDIALKLGISKPSVNRAVNTLKKQGLVSHKPYGDIVLTQCGLEMGEAVCHKHRMVKAFLMKSLNLTEEEADKEACRIQHSIGQNTINKMELFMDN